MGIHRGEIQQKHVLPQCLDAPVGQSTACEELAARQYGVVSREQALAAGLTNRAIDVRIASGRWARLHRGVYRALPLSPSWHQRLTAAVLHGGSSTLASHRAAAALWNLDGIRTPPIEISVKTGLRIEGAFVHRRRVTDDPKVTVIDGIPATCIERTLLDLAAVLAPARVGRAIDDALRSGETTLAKLHLQVSAGGRPGQATFRGLLNERDERDAKTESRLEAMVLQILRRRRLPLPLPQYRVIEAGIPIARLDFAYPEYSLGIEADGYRWHSGVQRWGEDIRRENRLKLLGWTLLHFSWADVRDRPELVASQIRSALEKSQGYPRQLPLG
jgi:very-short-patch-repair endonuclease